MACCGTQIFGGIGSGKSSGSGATIASKFLQHGFGGLILTAKTDERDVWIEYCRKAGRLEDLVIVSPQHKNYFNFLEYESASSPNGVSYTQNIVQLLNTVVRASEEKSGGKSDDPFWESSQTMLLGHVVSLCLLAYCKVTVEHLYNIVLTAPKKDVTPSGIPRPGSFTDAFERAQNNVTRQIEEYEAKLTDQQKEKLRDKISFEEAILDAIPDARTLKSIDQFFIEHFRNLAERTRSILEFSYSGFLSRLLADPFYSLFCKNKSTFTPEDCLNGKILLIDLPVKSYFQAGRDIQVIIKYVWQRAMEKRNIALNDRVVFLWADESQHFLHPSDNEFQATARSCRICTVYISQNIPSYHSNMGGIKSEYRVKGFLGTLSTKIFHANADMETNRYSSELCGDAYVEDESSSYSMSGKLGFSRSKSYKLERMTRPEAFVSLRQGGPRNNYQVEAYMHLQGEMFPDGMSYRKITFIQQ